MFARVTPMIRAVVGSIATNQTCTEIVKSRTSAPVIKCVTVRVNLELRGVLILQQDVVTAYPPMILAAQVFSLIGFLKEDFSCRIRACHLDDYDTLSLILVAGRVCIVWQKWG